jgi:uncharacterized protein
MNPLPDESPDEEVVRDLARIARHAHKCEDEDYRFRVYLKVHLPMANDELDRVVQSIANEVWAQIDCTTCANCCRTLQIVVDNKDIARLAKRLGISNRAFVERYVGEAEDRTKHFVATPCAFLGEDNRCTVYEDRPQACRDYPYLFERHFRSRTFSMIENSATCPIVFNVWDRLKKRFKNQGRPRRRRR